MLTARLKDLVYAVQYLIDRRNWSSPQVHVSSTAVHTVIGNQKLRAVIPAMGDIGFHVALTDTRW